jgi:hypothetical protein
MDELEKFFGDSGYRDIVNIQLIPLNEKQQ